MKNIRFAPGTHINEFLNCAYEKWDFDMDPEAKKHGNHSHIREPEQKLSEVQN